MTALEELKKPEYDFLRTDPRLGSNLCLLTIGGSRAYGMDREDSDWDFRGCFCNTKKEILTGVYQEQVTSSQTDTVVYSFQKLLELLMNCNPNVIELLGCRACDYLYMDEIGLELLRNSDMFLSKRCINSFGGYANQQLRRLQNAVARDRSTKDQRELHILNTIKNMKFHLAEVYPGYTEDAFRIYIDQSSREDQDTEIFIDYNLKHVPLRDFRGVMSEMNTVINEYEKLNKRNSKKDWNHLAKHMAHLLRLYMMSLDILEEGKIITYRDAEHDLLMKTRNGEFLIPANDDVVEAVEKEIKQAKEEFKKKVFNSEMERSLMEEELDARIKKLRMGFVTVEPEFWEILQKYEDRFEQAKKKTKLPDQPDRNRIQEFQMRVNQMILNK